jgi:putative phosphoribosyl transferase
MSASLRASIPGHIAEPTRQRFGRIVEAADEFPATSFSLHAMSTSLHPGVRPVRIEPNGLQGLLGSGDAPKVLVMFAHGSGSGRLSPRNNHVASGLRDAGCATLLLDLLRPDEEGKRANTFDIALLASRLLNSARWVRQQADIPPCPLAFFGASTGAAAALVAATDKELDIAAVVSRGGRPDLAGDALAEVRAPTLLIVGSLDTPVIELNRQALARMRCPRELAIVPGAGHLFEEPGALDQVITLAADWFIRHVEPT